MANYNVSPHAEALLAGLSGRDLSNEEQAKIARTLVERGMLALVKDFRDWVRREAAKQGVTMDYDE